MIIEKAKEIVQTSLEYVKGKTGFIKDGDWIETKDQDPNGEVRLIQLADIGDGEFLNKSKRYLTKETAVRLNCTFLEKGDLLVARMPDPLGRACIFPGDVNECVTAVDVMIIRVDKTIINTQWLKFKINSPKIRNTLERFITGTTRQRISRSNFEKIPLDVPDIITQIRIAELLENASSLIKKRQETIKLADEFLRSTFLEMFGDPANNTKQYPIVNLNELCSKITDGTHDTPVRLSDGVKFITGKHIRPFIIDYDNSDYVKPEVHKEIFRRCNPEYGDVLYTNIGVNLGTAAMNTVEYEFSMKNVALLKIDGEQISSRYLEHILNNENMKRKILNKAMVGGAQQFLSLRIINEIEIPVPGLADQTKFSEIVEMIQTLKIKYNSSLSEMENQFNSLMQKAFKGEL